jgi:SNF2-related domain/SNF2 Helicase protein/Helicase conserved C-terminal domain
MNEVAHEFLFCTPEPRLFAGSGAPHDLAVAFEGGDAAGLLLLATALLKDDLPPECCWARHWSKHFFAQLCQTRDPEKVTSPDADVLKAMVASAPPMRGAEYLSEDLLLRIWTEFKSNVASAAATHVEGLEGWLRDVGALWHLVGRVTFHLAENKRNVELPFAFLATYSDQLSADGRVQHTPLGRALLASQKNQLALDALLEPVRAAAQASPLVRDLLETKRLFQALAWSPQEAFELLRQVPLLEQCGLVVKLPDWWKGRRPARPVVSVSVDAPEAGGLGVASMLSFRMELSLGGEKLTDEELKQIHASPSGLVNLRGQWVEVDRRQWQQALDHWSRVQSAHQSGGLSFHEGMRWLAGFSPGAQGDADTPDLDSGRNWTEVVAGKNLKALLERLHEPKEVSGVPDLRATLRPYQARGVAWLHFVSQLGLGACLADDMGLGKTVQVIALLCLRRSESLGVCPPSLLVVPASLMGNWMREFRQFAPHLRILPAHRSLVSRETLASLETQPEEALGGFDALLTTYGLLQRSEALINAKWDIAVLDEAQAIKNSATRQSRCVKKLTARARVALTGTPVENRLGDLWSLFDFLNPGLLGKASEFSIAAGRMAASPGGYAPLRRLLAPYLLRRLKTDRRIISDLPEKIEMNARCVLTKKQAVLYGKLVAQLKEDLENEAIEPNQRRGLVLGYLIKFKQVCNHPSHWSGDGRFGAEESGKFLRLGEIAAELAERQERCLIFTQFREMTEPLAAYLAGIFGRQGLVLHGGTPVGQRQRLVETFQQAGGPPFFVLSVKAGGTGLTLTAANHVIHFDRWWNPAVENQATDRAFRIGQKRNVLVHKFLCPGTIEEKVDALISKKGALSDQLLGGEGGPEKLLTDMSTEELLEFVRLDIGSATM